MPVAPRKPCRYSSCNELVRGSAYCEKHTIKKEAEVRVERIKYDKERGTSASRGYGSRWSTYSKQFRVNNPLCVMCLERGKLTKAECVDHIEAVDGKDDLKFWEPTNHQSLCHSCHSEKTVKEDGGLGNQKRERFI